MNQEFEDLREKAKEGDAIAQYKIGYRLIEGKTVPKDLKEGCKWLEASAKASNPHAQLLLGDLYGRGEGVQKNYEIAVSWYQKAAKGRHPEALYKMGLLMITTRRDADSIATGEDYIRTAANSGSVNAQYELALLYSRGSDDFHVDGEESIRWLKKAAEKGHLTSLNLLGYLYANGTSDKKVKIDEEEAIKYWKEAADREFPESQYNLANLYLKRANDLWEASAMKGFQKSKYMLNMLKNHDLRKK
jgi:TPR repeat protein